jgi:hypothetical protein
LDSKYATRSSKVIALPHLVHFHPSARALALNGSRVAGDMGSSLQDGTASAAVTILNQRIINTLRDHVGFQRF